MSEVKRFRIADEQFLFIEDNGIVSFQKNGKKKSLKLTLDKKTRKDKSNSYYRISVNGKVLYLHRIVAMAFIPNPHNYKFVTHKDGDTLNNFADNLEWSFSSKESDEDLKEEEAKKYYKRLSITLLSSTDKAIYDYFMYRDESKIAELFQSKTLKYFCKRNIWVINDDEFQTVYDDLYEKLLLRIRRGTFRALEYRESRFRIVRYCGSCFYWLYIDRKMRKTKTMTI